MVEIYKFKAKDSEVSASPLCLGKVLKDLSTDILKNTRLHWYIYHFTVDYDSKNVADILNIHKYLIKKHVIK